MAEEKDTSKPIEGEDFVILSPQRNATTILPWNLRVISDIKRPIRIAFGHTNLMTKIVYITEEEERADESAQKKEIIAKRISEEI